MIMPITHNDALFEVTIIEAIILKTNQELKKLSIRKISTLKIKNNIKRKHLKKKN